MNTEAFQKDLYEKGSYKTDPHAKRSFFNRMFGWLDIWFYMSAFVVVLTAARISKKKMLDDKQWARHSFGILRAIEACGGKVEISGLGNIVDNTSPCVFIGNHMSIIETFLLPVILLPLSHLTIVVKESLLNYPVFGHVMRAVRPISVGRADPRGDLKKMMSQGCASIDRGESVLVFPQSTRSFDVDTKSFNSVGIKLAKRAGADIIPVAVKTDFLGIGKMLRDFGPVHRDRVIHIEFGKVMSLKGNGKAEHEEVLEFIVPRLKKWREEEQRDT